MVKVGVISENDKINYILELTKGQVKFVVPVITRITDVTVQGVASGRDSRSVPCRRVCLAPLQNAPVDGFGLFLVPL